MRHLPLLTPRLRLRPFTADDLPDFTAYRSHPDVTRYQSWSDYSAADAQAFFARQRRLEFNRDDSWFQLAVERRENGALLGDIAVHFFDEGRQAELGVTFAPSHQRQGLAREALNAVIALLFGPLAKHRITAVVDARNLAAATLFGKLGFRREAHWRQNVFSKARGATNSVSLCCKANGGRMQSMTLLNKYLGQYQFSERHAIAIAAPQARILAAVAAYDPKHDRFFRSMIALRELPARLMPRNKPSPPPFGLHNFCLLEQDDSALVYGLIGRFWQAEYGLEQVADGAGFLAFVKPGVAKLALGYVVSPLPDGRCRLVTETRIFCPDDASRRRFTLLVCDSPGQRADTPPYVARH